MSQLLDVDGSMGEGGGQVLRAALSLSAITGRGFRMERIRAGRKQSGLAAQHLTCVRAAAKICSARVSGDRAGSQELSFRPGKLRPGEYEFRVRTAGSAALVAQTVALPLSAAEGESSLTIGGGTHVDWSPTAGYLAEVWCRAVGALGLHVDARLSRAGYYPRGGGEILLSVRQRKHPIMPLDAAARGSLRGVRGNLVVSRLPEEVVRRCRGRADALLAESGLFAEWTSSRLPAASPGICLEIFADFGVLSAGFVSPGKRGKPAEQLAEEAVGALIAFLGSGAAVDMHLADQLVLPLALAPGASRFTTSRVTSHLLTVLDVVSLFLPEVEVAVEGECGEPGQVQILGCG
jgi:RNA 3'-terminal phosphate cyclase (ATP)